MLCLVGIYVMLVGIYIVFSRNICYFNDAQVGANIFVKENPKYAE